MSVQLIRESVFGPGRFEPTGPRLHMADRDQRCACTQPAPSPSECGAADNNSKHPPRVETKPSPPPIDLYTASARPIVVLRPSTAVVQDVQILPSHLVGSLLDVLA